MTATGAGEYRVTLDVVARKMRADSAGEALLLQQHRIRSGAQTISLTVDREPARAGIDPSHTLIDRQGHDNVVGVDAAGAKDVP